MACTTREPSRPVDICRESDAEICSVLKFETRPYVIRPKLPLSKFAFTKLVAGSRPVLLLRASEMNVGKAKKALLKGCGSPDAVINVP